MDYIKWFLDKWYHRLQGHILVTAVDDDGNVQSNWALDVHIQNDLLVADLCDGSIDIVLYNDSLVITG